MNTRTETGQLQFADDWPGIFIRGDDALCYASVLKRLFAKAEKQAKASPETFEANDWIKLQNLAVLLDSCRVNSDGHQQEIERD